MKTYLVVLLLLLVAVPARADGWKLVWSDEFDKPGLPDPTKWTYEVGFLRNREAQYYTRGRPENARIENGMLIIEARKEHFSIHATPLRRESPGRRAFAEYTSASLTTRGKASWTYGRIEARAKLPTGRGTWPAIWTLGSNIPTVRWPACGEIDIMENVGFDPDVIHANIHTPRYNHVRGTNKGAKITVPKPSQDFHVYALEWYPDHLDMFVDGRKYFTFTNEGQGRDVWPFNQPQYLLLNLAIGGNWGGQKGIDDQGFPHRYYIDYVRVYQHDPSGK
jgi:beta-glucanase (GH16 family)